MEERDQESKSAQSTANVTDDREAHPERWYVARVQMKCEKASAKRISALGYDTFVPVQEEIRQWSDRKKKIERVLIPLMVFFRADEAGSRVVQRQSYVYDLLKAPGERKAAIVPDAQIDRFKFMIGNCDGEITIAAEPISAGDRVRVVRGALKGLDGYAATSSDGKSRIFIIIDNLCCASVEISPSDLERI